MTHSDDVRTVGDTGSSSGSEKADGKVTVHECSPDRTVFTEIGNTDGWIATDTTVSLGR